MRARRGQPWSGSYDSQAGAAKHGVEAVDNHLAVDGLAEEPRSARRLGALAEAVRGKGSDEDDRHHLFLRKKHGLQVQSAHSWHMDVGDQARRVLPARRSEESFSRVEYAGFVA